MGPKMKRLAIISDPHCGEPSGFFRRTFGRHDKKNGERLARICATLEVMDEEVILLVLGDLTDRSTEEECEEVFRALSIFSGEKYVVLGNHDETSPFRMGIGYSQEGHLRASALAATINGEDGFPLVIDKGPYQIILLDSNAHGEKGTAFARGRIGNRQLAMLGAQLSVNKPTVLAMHHYPEKVNATLAVSDADALLTICKSRDVTIVNGHRHREGEYQRTPNRPRILTHGKCTDTGRVRLYDPVSGESEWLGVSFPR